MTENTTDTPVLVPLKRTYSNETLKTFSGVLWLPAMEALRRCGLEPLVLEAKEGLALINGTQGMTAIGVLAASAAGRLAKIADLSAALTIEAVKAAQQHGTIVSYDLNYRGQLWKSQGGKEGAQKINREIAKYIDVMLGNEEDFTACLGFEVEGLDEHISKIDPANFKKMIATAVKEYPNFKVAATTLRNAKTASVNDWGAVIWAGGQFYEAPMRENLEIYDRVGGGDGFASGLAYGFIEGKGPQAAVEYGAAHGALAMTTPGDTSMVNYKEVEAVMKGKGARVVR